MPMCTSRSACTSCTSELASPLAFGAALPVLTSKDTRVEFADWQLRAADLATFEVLRRAALFCIAVLHRQPLPGWGPHEIILERIRGNAEQITAILRALGHADIASDAASIDIGGSLGLPQVAAPAPLLSQGEVVLPRSVAARKRSRCRPWC